MIALLFIAMFQASAGEPQTPAPDVAAPEETETTPDSVRERRERHRVICRSQTTIGSRIASRVCMSADLEEQRRETQRIADQMHRGGAYRGGMGGCTGTGC